MNEVLVVAAKRTRIGRFQGTFKEVSAIDLGVESVRAVIQGLDPKLVDEVIFGNARQAGNGPNPARQVAVLSGLPVSTPAFTVNKACASGLKAITLGWQAISLGDAEVVVCGGTENMTRTPFLLNRMRQGYHLGHAPVMDGQYQDGFLCPLCGLTMGETAERLAQKYGIGRADQDRYAFESQRRYSAAAKILSGEITSGVDEPPRNTTLEQLARLPPAFLSDGSVTAGNSCAIADAGAAVLLMSSRKAKLLGITGLARIAGYSQVGVEPEYMGLGPVEAIRRLQRRFSVNFDLVELNEAFAVQVLACAQELKLDLNRTNVNGGAIALGHPIGASGARIVVTLLHEMARRKSQWGLAALCISGGMGMAVAFEALGR